MTDFETIDLNGIQRRAVMKIAVELVKADSRIHTKEVGLLDRLQSGLGLEQKELDLTHYLSLENAVECLKGLEDGPTDRIISLFNEIIRADDDISFDENLLLASISMSCGTASREWCGLLSVNAAETEVPDRQIVFLEREVSETARLVFGDKYDNLLISKAFGDIGLDFFYLPDIIKEFSLRFEESERFDLLKRSMEYIVPAGDKIKLNNLKDSLMSLDSRTFYHIILSRFDIAPDRIPYPAFLLVKVRDSQMLDDSDTMRRMVDFLYLDISSEVKKRILSFVSMFDKKRGLLSYNGYHKFLFDYLSSESKTANPITINAKGEFLLESGNDGAIRFESGPQAVTLYLALMRRGGCGVTQSVFRKAIDFLESLDSDDRLTASGELDLARLTKELAGKGEEYADLIIDAIAIYGTFSTKDSRQRNFLGYIKRILKHRSSLKTYINIGFSSARKLANAEHYMVSFNPDLKAYSVSASPSHFLVRLGSAAPCPLTDTDLWKSLR